MNQQSSVREVGSHEDSVVATFMDPAKGLLLPEPDRDFLYEHGEPIAEGS